MRKIIVFIALLLAVVLSVASCKLLEPDPTPPESITPDSQQTTGGSPQQTPKNVWETLQELSKKSYSKVMLNITTVTGDIELNASYSLTNQNVTYSVEQLNLLPPNGDLTNVTPNYKTTLSGTATIKNGKVEKIDGEAVTLPSYDELKGAFNFKESNFKNVKTEKGKLTADVSSVSNFMGHSQNWSNMKIVVTYSDTALQKLEITYNTTNSMVTTVYDFTS